MATQKTSADLQTNTPTHPPAVTDGVARTLLSILLAAADTHETDVDENSSPGLLVVAS